MAEILRGIIFSEERKADPQVAEMPEDFCQARIIKDFFYACQIFKRKASEK